MSAPGHHNVVEVCGEVQRFYRSPLGVIAGVLLQVHVDEPAAVVVVAKTMAMPKVHKGQRLFIRGQLASEHIPGQPWPLLCVMAKSIEVLKPRPQEGSDVRHG
jgi:hypothetical protein